MTENIDRLIVLGSTITALALVRNAHELGIECKLVDTAAGIATCTKVAPVTVLEGASDKRLVQSLIEMARGHRTALIADSDAGLRVILKNRDILRNAFDQILHPENEFLELCLNKSSFQSWCSEAGLPSPARIEIEGCDLDSIDYPVIVRPASTKHGIETSLPKAREVLFARDLKQLLDIYAAEGSEACVSTSLIRPGIRQYSVGVARRGDGRVKVFVAEKVRPSPRFCAGGTYVVACPDATVRDFAKTVVAKLQYFGIAEVEVMKDELTKDMYVVEVNPRPWAQYSLAYRSNYDFLRFLLSPERYDDKKEREAGRRWLSFGDDLYVVFSRSEGMLRHREVSLLRYLRSLIVANTYPLFSKGDLRPFLERLLSRFKR